MEKAIGKVYLVGAGPGDEGLLTVKGKELLSSAEVVVYDYLVNPALLTLCPQECEKVYVGKRAGDHSMKQDAINELLLHYAKAGKKVIRLKGGDPFVFGRGGEEVLALVDQQIPFEVIPGITAGVAVPAYAGIPVTHREIGTTVSFITGHLSKDNNLESINWRALGELNGTLVFYMGIINLSRITELLIANGKEPQTPVALIRMGTYPNQQSLFGTLDDIVEKAATANFHPPALIVVGRVVDLHSQLDWLTQKALHGKRVLVTRSREQISTLSQQLRERGAEVIELPTIEIVPVTDYTQLDTAINRLGNYQWVIFTSVNGVDYFFHRLYELKKDARALVNCKIALVGRETALALKNYGLLPDLTPDKYTSEALADSFTRKFTSMAGQKVLIPTSNIARDVLPQQLTKLGAIVDVITAYNNQQPEYEFAYLKEIFDKPIDLVAFTSSSTVNHLSSLLKKHELGDKIQHLKSASIGPVTSKSIHQQGFSLVVEANEHTIHGLVKAIHFFYNP